MAKDKEKEEKTVDQRIDEISAAIGAMAAEMKRHSENWKRHMIKFHDSMGGGKVGLILLAFALATSVFAADRVVDSKTDRANTTIYQLTTDDAGLGNIIITGDLTSRSTNIVVGATTTNMSITGTLEATGDTTLSADVTVSSNLTVSGNATVAGTFGVTDDLTITKTATFLNGITIQTNAAVGGTLAVTGASTLIGAATMKTANIGNLVAQTNATVGGTLDVTGVATFTAVPVLTEMITTGTNTAILGTCPGPLVTNTPVWFKVTSTNGTDYVFPAYVAP